ncbi:hypothetical protein ACSBR1_033652 [Camellia fascicularis]
MSIIGERGCVNRSSRLTLISCSSTLPHSSLALPLHRSPPPSPLVALSIAVASSPLADVLITTLFFRQFLLFFVVHLAATSMFRFLASIFHTVVASNTTGIVWEDELKPSWLRWGFWLFPMTYGERGLALNEFLAPRWQKLLVLVLLFQMKSFPKFKDLKIPPVLPMQKQNLQILLTILQNLIKGICERSP